MTDRINAILVVLDRDVRDDDLEATLTAIRMTKGVLTATPNVAHIEDQIALSRARADIERRLWTALNEKG